MDNISSMATKFKSFAEMQDYCNSQYHTIQVLSKENEQLKTEIEHLKGLVAGAVPLIDAPTPEPSKIQVSVEQAIVEMQIEKLRDDAMKRQLTLEETKRLDLLIKNLHLVKGQSTQIVKNELTGNFSEADLLRIACLPETTIEG